MTHCTGFAPTEKMLDPTALAEMLRISERHLTDLRREDRTFPAPQMLGTLPRWSPTVIRRWMEGPAAAEIGADPACGHGGTAATEKSSKGSKKRKGNARVH